MSLIKKNTADFGYIIKSSDKGTHFCSIFSKFALTFRNVYEVMSVYDFEMEMCCSMQVRSLIHELELCKQVGATTGRMVSPRYPAAPRDDTLFDSMNLYAKLATLDMKKWENDYRQLLDQLRAVNPDVIIALGTPFVAKVGRIGTEDNFPKRKELIAECAIVVRRIATDYDAILLDYEKMFNALTENNASYWIWDGIHPTAAGHQKIADMWIGTLIDSKQ